MLFVVRVWILLSALLVGAGWILSACHELNRIGYATIFALAAAVLIYWRKKIKWPSPENFSQARHKFYRRFKRPAPLLFLALASLALLAGVLYAPFNWDSDAYRIPRVLHWLGHAQWHWIRTLDARMNIANCGFEWLSAPLILFTRTDRFLFLINWLSYLMLPGLIFSVFTRLQVRPRTAWWWTWIVSSGWCFVLQAGSITNDSFAAIYALAAIDFALRARENKSVGDLWLSMLAVALLTGAKQTNIPLALLWLLAAWPALRLMFARPVATIFVAAFSLLISAAPVVFLNFQHTGNIWGIASQTLNPQWHTELHSPFWGIIGNIFCLPVQNLLPPFFPWADAWNEMMQRFLETPFGAHFTSFESFGGVSAVATETSAGIGLGICVLIFISILKTGWHPPRNENFSRLLCFSPWLLLLLFMAKVGTAQNARQLAPYYIFLFPLFLAAPGHSQLTRRLWWQKIVYAVMLLAALTLAIAPRRPLIPAKTIVNALQAGFPQSKFIARAGTFISRPSSDERRDFFKKNLPPDETLIAYAATSDADEPVLWLPLGQRRVERMLPGDTSSQLRAMGIHYVVIESTYLDKTIEQWLAEYDGELIGRAAAAQRYSAPAGTLYLVRLHQPPE
jgi:hypothetical protein